MHRKGFTIVELIIVLTLLGIVLGVGYNLFFYGENTFRKGSNKYQLQSDVRLASDFISEEIRNAVEVDIISLPITAQTGYHYIYLDGSIIKYLYNGNTENKTTAIMNNQAIFSIRKDSSNKNFLKITLKGKLDGQEYDLETEIYLSNISNKAATSGKAIRYKKP